MFDTRSSATSLTVGAFCGIGILLILIPSGIFLSLIQIYLPVHGSTLHYLQNQIQLFYMEYSADAENKAISSSQFAADSSNAQKQFNDEFGLPPVTNKVENMQHSNAERRDQKATQTATTGCCNSTSSTLSNIELVQNCIAQNINKNPIIIDTDSDIDDLWAILYLMNGPTIDILAVTTVGDGYSAPLYSASNVISMLGLVGCTDGVAVGSGLSTPSLPNGFILSSAILGGIDTYLSSPSCLNQSVNIYLQPSPFDSVELIVYALKYSQQPVDVLALGPFTNIAAAIVRDRSIIPKIGTLYVSGIYPYTSKTSGSSSNVFLDVLAVQRVDDSGIKKLVAIPSTVQKQLPTNISQVNMKLKQLNITLSPFIYGLITSLAKCTNQSESTIYWWDNSAAQLMVQLQNNVTNGFCTAFQNVESLYILSADADQLFGQGLTDFQNTRPNTNGLSNYTICAQTNSDTFLTEFLTKISSDKFYSCEKTYANRFDLKLQSCMSMYGLD
ncbi:unnamed protein product [Rotaria socialis]|uniref:Inosine/uridine-preferring nucleoside hydrolase domain-containing protein n=1 Tax=Rotaria socialis TaxID=392032 RepID=A0A818R3T8_9BILA|nr:unnamed protein product [Rotaria socialis]